jgi:hypothetical protein
MRDGTRRNAQSLYGQMMTKISLRRFSELRFQLVYFHRDLAEVQNITGDTYMADVCCCSEMCMQMKIRYSCGVILNILELCRHRI